MKKSLLTILGLLILSTTSFCFAEADVAKDVMDGIKLYKAHNYSGCYEIMTDIVKADPSNALAYYYLAMSSSQIGKKEEAIQNYNKVISLSSEYSNIGRYARKGKVCLEDPEACNSVILTPTTGDDFVTSKFGPNMSSEVNTQLEKLKRDQLRRDINRNENVDIKRFREFKDFSTMNNVPSNDEVVAAMRTLQQAGFGNIINNNNNLDISMLTGMGQQNQMFGMLGGNSSLSPQVIQALLTNNMSQGF